MISQTLPTELHTSSLSASTSIVTSTLYPISTSTFTSTHTSNSTLLPPLNSNIHVLSSTTSAAPMPAVDLALQFDLLRVQNT